MRVIYFDCASGASGDMIVGAMLDAGVSVETLTGELAKLGVGGFHVETRRVTRGGIAGAKFDVVIDTPAHAHRHLSHIRKIINESTLSDRVKRDASRVFERLAEAEARVHDVAVEKVHFHEVGAVDAIVDVVSAAVCLESLGIDAIVSSALPTGCGFVTCAHGTLPVPAPATAALLEGFPVAASDVEAELTTPTGAAILTTLAERFGGRPAMTLTAIGSGAGSKDLPETPNLLRVFVGETEHAADVDRMWLLETNIDDMPAELFEGVFEKLLDAGAVDVFTTPIGMKRSRPGVKLSALVSRDLRARAEEIIFRETTTFGIRACEVSRRKLRRESVRVETGLGEVAVKLGRLGDELITVSPEYRDCKRVADAEGVALKEVYEKARLAARTLT